MIFHAHGIPQVAPPLVGVHLLWQGPHTWIYSPAGWTIQRRLSERAALDCLALTPDQLSALRARHELQIRFGVLTERIGPCPAPLVPAGAAPYAAAAAAIVVPPSCEVITLELDTPQPFVRVHAQAAMSWAVALRNGKAVAAGAPVAGAAVHALSAPAIDTVKVYARGLTALGFCILRPEREDSWRGAQTIAQLQIPIRELMPSLTTPDREFAEAKSRLLPGETLDRAEFEGLTEILRRVVASDGPPRPIDLALLLRSDPDELFDELVALDPLASLLPHPKWRRVLGFAYFDRDRTLVQGESYQYRISGQWPAADLVDRVYGFHTAPATTPIPREIYLHDLRLRLPDPAMVELHDEPTGLLAVRRRGIRLSPERLPFWLGPDLEGWSAVIDFPSPVKSVVLELGGAAHSLMYTAGAAWLPPGAASAVPPGNRPRLDFPAPVHQLRLTGEGFLCAVRVPPEPAVPSTLVRASVVLPPIVLADAPLPPAPLTAAIANLQQPVAPAVVADATELPPPKHALGFEVRWTPATVAGLTVWPPDLPPPPSDATLFQVEHSSAGGAPTAWTPLLTEENYMTGHRDAEAAPAALSAGGDLMQSFPEIRQPSNGSVTIFWRDVFDFKESGEPVRRELPPPGTFHKYRVRAVDAIGRTSPTWRETGELRLEKWIPPPQPGGPDATKADELVRPTVTGVQARVLVRGASDLTPQERAVLGSHSNAIVLRWGWHANHREQDPFAAEFRVYRTKRRLDAVVVALTGVTALGNGDYSATITPAEPILANASAGLRLDAGYPFEIVSHGGGAAGSPVPIALRARVQQGSAFPVPADGTWLLPLKLAPDRTRAPAWGPRVEVQPITTATAYQAAPIFDLLDLSADHPRDEAFVGVSVADAQGYVPDPLAAGRPGNESAIAAVPVQGRWHGRPDVTDAPALEDVPVVVAPEPAPRPMRFELDLTPLLAGSGLSGTERVRPERTAADEVFRAYRVDGTRLVARVLPPEQPGDVEQEVTVPNAADRSAILAAIGGNDVGALADRYAVFLAAAHPFKSRLFRRAADEPVALPRFTETLPNKAARWIYRVRLSDAAGHLSLDGITLRGIVRVPATTRVPAPRRDQARAGDPPNRIRLAIDGPAEITHVLVFRRQIPPARRVDAAAELLRVPGATRLAPGEGVRVRLGDGTLLAPEVKSLGDPDVEGAPPARRIAIDVPAAAGQKDRVWAVAITRDGVASALAGSWTLAMPLPPLAAPALTVSGTGSTLAFSWTWPTAEEATEVILEAAAIDSGIWTRTSPRLARTVASFVLAPAEASRRYRLRALSLDGRTAASNEVTP